MHILNIKLLDARIMLHSAWGFILEGFKSCRIFALVTLDIDCVAFIRFGKAVVYVTRKRRIPLMNRRLINRTQRCLFAKVNVSFYNVILFLMVNSSIEVFVGQLWKLFAQVIDAVLCEIILKVVHIPFIDEGDSGSCRHRFRDVFHLFI